MFSDIRKRWRKTGSQAKAMILSVLAVMLIASVTVLADPRWESTWTATLTDTLFTKKNTGVGTGGVQMDTTTAKTYLVKDITFRKIGAEIRIDSVVGNSTYRMRPADSLLVEERHNYRRNGLYSSWFVIKRFVWNRSSDSLYQTTYAYIPDSLFILDPYNIQLRMIARDDTAAAAHTIDSSYTATTARLIAD
jgi:hypothetical protein